MLQNKSKIKLTNATVITKNGTFNGKGKRKSLLGLAKLYRCITGQPTASLPYIKNQTN